MTFMRIINRTLYTLVEKKETQKQTGRERGGKGGIDRKKRGKKKLMFTTRIDD